METLSTETVKTNNGAGSEEFVLQEKDHGDTVVYDVYRKDHCVMTLSKDGKILFMDFNVSDNDREFFTLSRLSEFIEKIASILPKK